jgi:transposase-like protein
MEEIDKRIVEVARSAVKEYLESLMNTERDVFIEEHGGLRNGFYERKVKTKFGEIEDLSVLRDREGRFRSAALEPYSRSIGLEELKRFQSRPLESRYIAIFLDALFFFLRKDTVEKEPILFAMGIRESGEYEYWDSILPPRNPICHIRQ